ncbi:MAG TPA: aminotransferase class I/II-fold pyridoxal phosphate-dependent enzyme [Longimicrobiales bacterium]
MKEMTSAELDDAGRHVMEWITRYQSDPAGWPVLPSLEPGSFASLLPAAAPADGEPISAILADFERLVPPASTHWNHPGFFAYFSSSSSAPGVLAEALTAALNVNAMLWRTGPAATELEEVTLRWLAQLVGLPASLDGTINDTASTSTLHALAAAREAADLRVREHGLAGRSDLPKLRVYCSEEAHSSVDKAAVTLGLGLDGVRRVAADDSYRLDVAALEAAIAEDVAAGIKPIAVVATVGTTSTTSVDPVREIAAVCKREKLWLHVDAAYGGAAAVVPEMRSVLDGCELADSIVINPHKWMFVPLDCSVLYTCRPDVLKRAFSLVPEYLVTADGARNLMDYGVALGRRFRALKLWFVLRYYGANGLADRIREHIRLAQLFASWVDASPDFERLAPAPFSTVVFRYRPPGVSDESELERINTALLARINESGEVYLSHTKAKGRYALRLAIGNVRTEEQHVAAAWRIIQEVAH